MYSAISDKLGVKITRRFALYVGSTFFFSLSLYVNFMYRAVCFIFFMYRAACFIFYVSSRMLYLSLCILSYALSIFYVPCLMFPFLFHFFPIPPIYPSYSSPHHYPSYPRDEPENLILFTYIHLIPWSTNT